MKGEVKEWLRQLAHVMPGECSPGRISGLQRMEGELLKRVPAGLLKPSTVRPVVEALTGFPTVGELADVICRVAPKVIETSGEAAPAQAGCDGGPFGFDWVAQQLAVRIDRKHIMSLVEHYGRKENFERIMQAHFPQEWAERMRALESRRTDARLAQRLPDLRLRDNTPRSAPREAQIAAVAPPAGPARVPSALNPAVLLAKLEADVAAGKGSEYHKARIPALRAQVEARQAGAKNTA